MDCGNCEENYCREREVINVPNNEEYLIILQEKAMEINNGHGKTVRHL
jgi:hypothetical protein